MIHKTWKGYEVSKMRGNWPVYVKHIRNGRVTWVTDYTYAAHYSEKTARKHDENIRRGIYENC